MKIALSLILLFLSHFLFAQSNCLSEKNLLELDLAWEKAQLEADTTFLKSVLAEDFLWVHNHSSFVEGKSSVIQRAARQLESGENNTRSRNSQEVKVMILGNTAVVNGFTIVDRGPKPTKYSFMRTYAEINGNCYLLANHTMAVPDDE